MFIFTESEKRVDDMRVIKLLSGEDDFINNGYTLIEQSMFDTETGIMYSIYKIIYDSTDKPSTLELEIVNFPSTIKRNGEIAQAFWMQLSYVMSIGDNLKHPERKEIISKMRDLLK